MKLAEIVRNLYDDFNAGNVPAVVDRIHDNAVWLVHGPSEIPTTIDTIGKNNVLAYFGRLGEAMEILKQDFTECIVEGNLVITIGEAISRVRATNRTHETIFVDRLTIKDGQIIRFERLTNTIALYHSFVP